MENLEKIRKWINKIEKSPFSAEFSSKNGHFFRKTKNHIKNNEKQRYKYIKSTENSAKIMRKGLS